MKEAKLREALEWYKERAEAIVRYTEEGKPNAILACVTELRLDGGMRATMVLEEKP